MSCDLGKPAEIWCGTNLGHPIGRPKFALRFRISGLALGVEDEVVLDLFAFTVFGRLWVQHQFWFDGRGDVVVVVFIAGEIELGGEQFVTWSRNLDVDVGRTPCMPACCCNQLTTGTLGWDLIGSRPDGGDIELAVFMS